MLLMQGGVESNPGPGPNNNKSDLEIRTYNCNGLGDINKLRRLFTKVRKEVEKGGIVLLQETHVKDESIIQRYWKSN